MPSKRKKQKPCPECGSPMETIVVKKIKDGVTYSSSKIECIECGFSGKIKRNKNNVSIRDWAVD